MTIEFFIFRLQKLSWSQVELYSFVDFVLFVERESTYNFFDMLVLRESSPILHELHAETQYVFWAFRAP